MLSTCINILLKTHASQSCLVMRLMTFFLSKYQNYKAGLDCTLLYGKWNMLYFSAFNIKTDQVIPVALDLNLSLMLGLSFSFLLFFIGLFGILLNQKNIIIIFLCVELMLFGAGLQFLFYFLFFNYGLGQIYALLILTIATAETAIGLGIIVLAYRLNRTVSFEAFSILRS